MLACLAETKFPEQRRDGTRQKPESIQEVSHDDAPKYDVREAKYFWKFGRTEFFPESDLNELFEVTDLAQSRQNRKDSPVPQGSDKIDELF